MEEVPPPFAVPRKYNTIRRRQEEEAIAQGRPVPEYKSVKRRDRSTSLSATPQPQSHHRQQSQQGMSGEGDEDESGEEEESRRSEFVGDYAVDEERSRSGTPGHQATGSPFSPFPTAAVATGSQYYATPSAAFNFTAEPIADPYAPVVLPGVVEAATMPVGITYSNKALAEIINTGDSPGESPIFCSFSYEVAELS